MFGRQRSSAAFSLLLILAIFLLNPSPASAQNGPKVEMNVQAGYDGLCRTGAWLPVQIRLQNDGPELAAHIEAFTAISGAQPQRYTRPVNLPTTSRKEVTLYVYIEHFSPNLTVRLIAEGQTLAEKQAVLDCISDSERLFGVMSDSLTPFTGISSLGLAGDRLAKVDLHGLPGIAPGLEALNGLIISGTDTGALSLAQQRSLQNWVAAGGRLVITGGSRWQETTAGLSDLLPANPTGLIPLPQASALTSYIGSSPEMIDSELLVTTLTLKEGAQVLVGQGDDPLVVRQTLGAGELIYLAFDPAEEPIRSWPGLPAFWKGLLGDLPPVPAWAGGFSEWSFARDALASLPDLGLPPAWLVIGFLTLYVLAIGPANFLLVKILKRRELAWITIPSTVILFTALGFLLGIGQRGERPVLARLAVVQSWPTSSVARVHGLVGVFSPSRATYQMELGPGFLVHPLGDNAGIPPSQQTLTIVQNEPGVSLPDLRLDVSELRTAALEGYTEAPSIKSSLVLDLSSQGGVLQGEVNNNGSQILQDAVLLGPGIAQQLGDLQPGAGQQVQLAIQAGGPAAQAGSPGSPSGTFFSGPNPGYSDPLPQAILGGYDFYSNPETYRRYMLLSAMVNYNQTLANGTAGGIYLAAWSDDSPVEASLSGRQARNSDLTLYLIRLEPRLQASGEKLRLDPGMFTWTVGETQGIYNPSAYNLALNQGSYSLLFRLAQPVDFSQVDSLILHLRGEANSGPSDLNLALWNYEASSWDSLPDLEWGDHTIEEPGRFVSPSGEIRLFIENPDEFSTIYLQSVDFTLEVLP